MILVGSKNPHKLHEVRAILEPLGLRAVIAVNLPEVVEDGETFADNARKKALEYAAFLRAPCLADDSGLVVPALGGEPGVLSARYAGPDSDDDANIDKLLRRLAEQGLVEPEAYFVCHVAIAIAGASGGIVVEAEGRVHGRIVHARRGEQGFGYDPVFFHAASDATFAELGPDRKNALSHRGNALRALAQEIPAVRDQLDI